MSPLCHHSGRPKQDVGLSVLVTFDIIPENIILVAKREIKTCDCCFSFYVPILSTKDDHFFHANRNIDKAVATAVELGTRGFQINFIEPIM